jgi:hypothetical protein
MDKRFGSIEGYFADGLGIDAADQQQLRDARRAKQHSSAASASRPLRKSRRRLDRG